ncbi:MAG TPA: arylamine N-acetyltransferase, partial [Pirellulales bacterium]
GLFAAALEHFGIRLTRLQARVLMGVTQTRPRTHMAIEVHIGADSWLADVGYGGWGLLEPIPLVPGDSRQFAWDYRLREAGHDWILSALQSGQWQDLYAFSRAPNLPIDYEPANYFVWQHPDSIFRKLLIAQRPTPEVRYILRNRELVMIDAQGTTTKALATDAEVLEALAQHFSLDIGPGPWLRFDANQSL